jgi:hypothetical protein
MWQPEGGHMENHDSQDRALAPWHQDVPDDPPSRHDAVQGKRRRVFLDALAKCGCLRDAARAAGVSPTTVYDHQARDAGFARHCRTALDMAGSDIELHAWERGVVGVEEEVIAYGKVVGTRIRRSDMILKLLLQGSKPKKYGARPGFTRKRLAKAYRDEIEREVREEWRRFDKQQVDRGIDELADKIEKFHERANRRKIEGGWIRHGGGWIPPGWEWTGEGDPPVLDDPDAENFLESM